MKSYLTLYFFNSVIALMKHNTKHTKDKLVIFDIFYKKRSLGS